MVKKLLAFVLIFYVSFTYAETIKTDVLVIGDSPGAVTAAIQSARSKLKTTLVMPAGWLQHGMPAGKKYVITTNREIPTGTWGEFAELVKDAYKRSVGYDAAPNVTLKFEGSAGADVLKSLADTVKNLIVKLNTPYTHITQDGTGWEVTVADNGQPLTIKAKVLVDGTATGEVVLKAGAKLPPIVSPEEQLYRTAIAVSDIKPNYFIPVQDVIVRDADNLLMLGKLPAGESAEQYLPVEMAEGQGIGTIAAYLAFFKTTTHNLKMRIIQQELLDFKGFLVPFADIKPTDRYIRAVQQIGATGMLKGEIKDGELLFMPTQPVNTDEVKPVLTEIYSRAFLWFSREKPGEKFTVGNTLSIISEMTLSEPETLRINMRNDWATKFHFTTVFDLDRPITRLEFAVLINKYLNPFARTVDLRGEIVN